MLLEFFHDLKESLLETQIPIRRHNGSGFELPVFLNPTTNQLVRLIQNSKGEELRGLILNHEDVVFWDGMDAEHQQVDQYYQHTREYDPEEAGSVLVHEVDQNDPIRPGKFIFSLGTDHPRIQAYLRDPRFGDLYRGELAEAKQELISTTLNHKLIQTQCWVNPSKSEVIGLLNRHEELRGIAFRDAIVVWDAHTFAHWLMVNAVKDQWGFNTTGNESFYVVRPGEYAGEPDWSDETHNIPRVQCGGFDVMIEDHGSIPAWLQAWQGLHEATVVKLKETINEQGMWAFQDSYTNELSSMVREFQHGRTSSQPWPLIPAARLIKIWTDHATLGQVRDPRGFDQIKSIMIRNTARLKINTELAGHSPYNFEDIFENDGWEEPPFEGEERERFISWAVDCDTGWRISDYGLDGLIALCCDLLGTEDQNEQLVFIDRMFNIAHQRSDLASWYVRGGRATLNRLASRPSDGDEE